MSRRQRFVLSSAVLPCYATRPNKLSSTALPFICSVSVVVLLLVKITVTVNRGWLLPYNSLTHALFLPFCLNKKPLIANQIGTYLLVTTGVLEDNH